MTVLRVGRRELLNRPPGGAGRFAEQRHDRHMGRLRAAHERRVQRGARIDGELLHRHEVLPERVLVVIEQIVERGDRDLAGPFELVDPDDGRQRLPLVAQIEAGGGSHFYSPRLGRGAGGGGPGRGGRAAGRGGGGAGGGGAAG